MGFKIKPLILFFLFIETFPVLWGESVGLDNLIKETGTKFTWDSMEKKGLLEKENKRVLFLANSQVLLFNDTVIKIEGTIIYNDKGELIFSKDAANMIQSFFNEKEPKPSSQFRIAGLIIDPGHGGRDSGAYSTNTLDGVPVTLKEKNLVLEISLQVQELLKKSYPGKEIIMTRLKDSYPTLEERVEQANNYKTKETEGVLYISIHANASANKRAKGFEVWYLPESYRRDILDPKDDLTSVLNTILEEEFSRESLILAKKIESNLDKKIGGISPNRGVKDNTWFVVRNANMASVLVEVGFLTNKEEGLALTDPEYLQKISQAIYNGIVEFINFFEQ